MPKSASLTPEEFLSGPALDPKEIEARYPNAKRVLKGGLFISHDGRDFGQIRESIVYPVVTDRFMDGYFLHNRNSGGSQEYRELIRTALYYLDKFLLVVSTNSVKNEWVLAETAVALKLKRPIVVCLFDDSNPASIHRRLGGSPWDHLVRRRVFTVDFRTPLISAQFALARQLDKMLKRSPYERNLWWI